MSIAEELVLGSSPNPSNRGQARPGKLKVDWQSKELPALRAGSRELSGMLANQSILKEPYSSNHVKLRVGDILFN